MAEETTTTKRGRPRKDGAATSGDPESNNVTPNPEGEGSVNPGKTPTPITQRDTTAGVKVKYLSLKVGDDGAFDLSKMKDKSKAELREVFLKTSRKGELGPVQVPETFTPESMVGYVALLFGLEAQIVVKTKLADAETASQVFQANAQEQMAIAKPAAKVANKYLADFKYADEMALVGAIAEMTFAKIMLCRQMMALKQMEHDQQIRPNGHAEKVA